MLSKNLTLLFIALVLLITAVPGHNRKGPCDNFTLVTREEWRARPPVNIKRVYAPLNRVIIAHTATNASNCKNLVACIRTVQAVQTYHLEDKGWADIAYNFLIGGDGRVYEGNGWLISGAHTMGFNRDAIAIAFIGNYMNVAPSQGMLKAAESLIACGEEKGFLTPTREINGHRDVTCIKSPGDKLYNIIKMWKNYKGGRIKGYQC